MDNDTRLILSELSDIRNDRRLILSELHDIRGEIKRMENKMIILRQEGKEEALESRKHVFRIIKEFYDEYKKTNASWFAKIKRWLFE